MSLARKPYQPGAFSTLRPGRRKQRPPAPPPESRRNARQMVRERAKGRCEGCGQRVLDGTYSHRRPMGMGGTSRQEDARHGMWLGWTCCHSWLELHPEAGHSLGWRLWAGESFDRPVVLYARAIDFRVPLLRRYVKLTEEGGYSDVG